MSIELPPENLRNLLVIDYLLDHCSLDTIIKYFELADPAVTRLVQCNTRFCSLLAKYLRSMEQRKNVRFYFHSPKYIIHSETERIAEQILRKSQCMDCDIDQFDNLIEMDATMQMVNIKQSMYATSFDVLLHIAIPISARNMQMGIKTVSFQPNSTFLIESIDIDMSVEKSAKKTLGYTIHEKPSIRWSEYALQNAQREELITSVASPSQGLSATNACRKKFVSPNQQYPLKVNCKEWNGNYLIAVVLHCHREFTRENV